MKHAHVQLRMLCTKHSKTKKMKGAGGGEEGREKSIRNSYKRQISITLHPRTYEKWAFIPLPYMNTVRMCICTRWSRFNAFLPIVLGDNVEPMLIAGIFHAFLFFIRCHCYCRQFLFRSIHFISTQHLKAQKLQQQQQQHIFNPFPKP